MSSHKILNRGMAERLYSHRGDYKIIAGSAFDFAHEQVAFSSLVNPVVDYPPAGCLPNEDDSLRRRRFVLERGFE